MVSFQRLFLFSILFYLSSAASIFNFSIQNLDTSLDLQVVPPLLNIVPMPSNGTVVTDKLFKLNKLEDGRYSIESTKFSGYFVSCPLLSLPCSALTTPTEFIITQNDDRSYAIANSEGRKLTVGNVVNSWVSLEPSQKTLYQRFDIAVELD